MKKKRLQHPRDWHERRLEAERYQDRPRLTDVLASRASRAASARKKTGEGTGLANEPRPGLGSRTKKTPAKPAKKKKATARKPAKRKRAAHDNEPMGRDAPLPPEKPNQKQEEQSDTFASEEERDTGVSGHMSGD